MDRPAPHISIPNGTSTVSISIPNGPAGATLTVSISISNRLGGCTYFNSKWTSQWNTDCLYFNLQRTGWLLIFQSPMDRPAAHISIPNGPAGGTPTVLISIFNGLAGCSYFNSQWNIHCLYFNPQWTGQLLIF